MNGSRRGGCKNYNSGGPEKIAAFASSCTASMLQLCRSRAGALECNAAAIFQRFCADGVTGNGRAGVPFNQFASNRVDNGIKK